MKKIKIYLIRSVALISIAIGLLILPSCEKENTATPSIKYVRNYAASPNDTILNSVSTGQWVVLIGNNLGGVTQAFFGNTPATINSTFFSDTCIVIQIPSIPFQSVPRDKLNYITVVNGNGVANFQIPITGAPLITQIRNFGSAPNDTVLNSIVPGQKISIIGYNLKNASNISFQGITTDLNIVEYTDSSAVVQVPADLSSADAALVNTITYTTKTGTGSYSIKIIGPPIVTRISYELPQEGDSVYVFGNNFISVKNFSFGGSAIDAYSVISDSVIGFKAPALPKTGGPVMIETRAGTFTTAYKVNDANFINSGGMGIIANMEWGDYFGWVWWGGASLISSDPNSGWPPYNADFEGGHGMYMELKTNVLNGGAGDEWGNAVRLGSNQWLPVANLNDPANSWALKFEMNIPKSWKGGTLCIKSSSGNYLFRFEPWKLSASRTAAYSTRGWITVSIPLSAFRSGEGLGEPIPKISDLTGFEGKSELILYMHNYATAPTETGFYGAFDNFRVVKR